MTFRMRTLALSAAMVGTLAAAPATAHADQIDDVLRALPAGQISCEQASRYWTNQADYDNRVSQARAIAAFDRRGPQILDALARVDEAANRCGLKGGGAPAPQAPANPGNQGQWAPAPAAPAPTGQLIVAAPAGVPTFDVPVPNVATVRLPDLATIARQLLAKYAPGSSLPF